MALQIPPKPLVLPANNVESSINPVENEELSVASDEKEELSIHTDEKEEFSVHSDEDEEALVYTYESVHKDENREFLLPTSVNEEYIKRLNSDALYSNYYGIVLLHSIEEKYRNAQIRSRVEKLKFLQEEINSKKNGLLELEQFIDQCDCLEKQEIKLQQRLHMLQKTDGNINRDKMKQLVSTLEVKHSEELPLIDMHVPQTKKETESVVETIKLMVNNSEIREIQKFAVVASEINDNFKKMRKLVPLLKECNESCVKGSEELQNLSTEQLIAVNDGFDPEHYWDAIDIISNDFSIPFKDYSDDDKKKC